MDGFAVFLRLLGLVARTRLSLSQIDARIPEAKLLERVRAHAVGGEGRGDALGGGGRRGPPLDTTDGVRVVEDDGSWALVLPDPAEAVTHLWAEADDVDAAQTLLERWAAVVEQAVDLLPPSGRRLDRVERAMPRPPAARRGPTASGDHPRFPILREPAVS